MLFKQMLLIDCLEMWNSKGISLLLKEEGRGICMLSRLLQAFVLLHLSQNIDLKGNLLLQPSGQRQHQS